MTKRALFSIALVVLVAPTLACEREAPTIPNIILCGGAGSCGGNAGDPSPSPSPSPTPLPGCPPVTQVTVGLLGGGGATVFRVNTGQLLDVTPRNGNAEVPAHCHGATVQWSLGAPPTVPPTPQATCQLTGNLLGFTPTITCSTTGTVTVTADVAPPGGRASATFTVVQ